VHIATLRLLRLEASPHDMRLPETVSLVQTGLEFFLHGQGDFQSQWIHGLNDQPADDLIHRVSRNGLAEGHAFFCALALADV
jgi:hypothetical protein